MKKILLTMTLVLSLFSINAMASGNEGGFYNPSAATTKVKDLAQKNDNDFVILQGNIQQETGEDIYVFSDGSGTINIEIDNDDWNGQTITPQDIVLIKGQVDKDGNLIEIDVDEVQLVK